MGERAEAKKRREKVREENWNNKLRYCDKDVPELEKITWEEALEGKGFILKKAELVGKSRFTDVYKAKKKDLEDEICCKVIRLKGSSSVFAQIYSKRNLRVLMQLNHASILKIHKLLTTTQVDKLYVFMELGEQGNMTKYVKKNGAIKEAQAITFSKSLADALNYLHSLGVAHRRVHSDNAFVDKTGNARLGGLEYFQEVFDVENNGEYTPCWMSHDPHPYLAPEAMDGEPHDASSNDTWGFGCVLYFMLTAAVPFDAYKSKRKLKVQVTEKKWSTSEKGKDLSAPVKTLLDGIFVLDVIQRFAMDEVVQHPTLKG